MGDKGQREKWHFSRHYVAVTGRRIIILRIFIKKAQKTPSAEIRLARERLKEL